MRSKKFIFINPPYERLKELSLQSPPVGILYLATVLTENGYEAKVYDAESSFKNSHLEHTEFNRAKYHESYIKNLDNDAHPAWRSLRDVLQEHKPDFVGITFLTPAVSSGRKVARIAKEILPGAVILGGGPHLTILKEKAMRLCPEIDFGFVGEAEESILEFAKFYRNDENWRNIRGMIYRTGTSIVSNAPRGRIEILDNLPIPQRSLLINQSQYSRFCLGSVMASRGCHFSCSFCASRPLWGNKVTIRSARNVLEEIGYLVKQYKILFFRFQDDTFTGDKARAIEFCKLMHKKYGLRKPKWRCLTNVNCMDEELLYWLRKGGCRVIDLGVESGSDKILKRIRKNITTKQIKKASEMIKRKGLWLHALFMVGIPGETEEDVRKTINFIKEIRPDSVGLCTFAPHPGTELFDYLVAKGMIADPDDVTIYDHIGHHSTSYNFTENIQDERYKKLRDELLELGTKVSTQLTFRKVRLAAQFLPWSEAAKRLKYLLKRFVIYIFLMYINIR